MVCGNQEDVIYFECLCTSVLLRNIITHLTEVNPHNHQRKVNFIIFVLGLRELRFVQVANLGLAVTQFYVILSPIPHCWRLLWLKEPSGIVYESPCFTHDVTAA